LLRPRNVTVLDVRDAPDHVRQSWSGKCLGELRVTGPVDLNTEADRSPALELEADRQVELAGMGKAGGLDQVGAGGACAAVEGDPITKSRG
jgi:hypothetical protein